MRPARCRERESSKRRRPRKRLPVARDNSDSRLRCHRADRETWVPPKRVSLLRLEVRSKTRSRSLVPGRRSLPVPIRNREASLRALRVQADQRKLRRRASGACLDLRIELQAHLLLHRVPHPLLPAPLGGRLLNRVHHETRAPPVSGAAAGVSLPPPLDHPATLMGAGRVVPAAPSDPPEADTAAAQVQVVDLHVDAETAQRAICPSGLTWGLSRTSYGAALFRGRGGS
jgi:hypothetical protein